jgi:zinc/manganese transport system ATP-binding protein
MTGPAAGDWVLEARGLTLGYGRDALFRHLDFEVRRGEILGIVGPNGCGKTTLVKTLLSLLPPLDGVVAHRPGISISYVPQREKIDRLVPVSALEVVLMGPGSRAPALQRVRAADRAAAERALALVGIESLGATLLRNLSTGQQQRVLLARALATSPDVLVLDEPTAGMDIGGEASMIEFLRELNQRSHVTILIVTHVLPIVLNLATSIMLMSDHAVLHGAVDEVLREDRLSALYRTPIRLGEVDGLRTLVAGRSRRGDV